MLLSCFFLILNQIWYLNILFLVSFWAKITWNEEIKISILLKIQTQTGNVHQQINSKLLYFASIQSQDQITYGMRLSLWSSLLFFDFYKVLIWYINLIQSSLFSSTLYYDMCKLDFPKIQLNWIFLLCFYAHEYVYHQFQLLWFLHMFFSFSINYVFSF